MWLDLIWVVLLLRDGLARPRECGPVGASEDAQRRRSLLELLDFALRDLQGLLLVLLVIIVVVSARLLANSVNQIRLCQVDLLVQAALAQDLVERLRVRHLHARL